MSKNITIRQCVEFAINTEAEMADYYDQLAQQCKEDDALCKLFKTLSKDEEYHQKQFQALLEQADQSDEGLKPEDNDFLLAMSLSKTFSRLYGRTEVYYDKDSRDQVLFDVFEFEKATLSFYIALNDIMGNNKLLREIIDIEKTHVVAAMKMIVTDTEYTSMGDKWP